MEQAHLCTGGMPSKGLFAPAPSLQPCSRWQGPGDPLSIKTLGSGDGQPFLIPVLCAGAVEGQGRACLAGAIVGCRLPKGAGQKPGPIPTAERAILPLEGAGGAPLFLWPPGTPYGDLANQDETNQAAHPARPRLRTIPFLLHTARSRFAAFVSESFLPPPLSFCS